MNSIRLKAFNDAAKDVCMYCGNRTPTHNANPVHGPSGSGNWIHIRKDCGKTVLCIASAIFSRIEFENADAPTERIPG